jgi:Protein of unknown function (DUF3810)
MRFMKKTFLSKLSDWSWFILGALALLVKLFTPPQYIEQIYSREIFSGVRWLFDHSLAYSPFALLIPFYVLVGVYVFRFLKFLFSKKIPLRTRFTEGGKNLLNFIGFALFGFFILWGFNYGRVPFTQQIGLNLEKLDTAALRQELEIATADALSAREKCGNLAQIWQDYDNNGPLSISLEKKMRTIVSDFLGKNNFPNGGNPRARQIKPNGFLPLFGISGIYMPYIGEANIDAALYPLEKPFTMAHELAHAYGWGDEATCNFIAYLACRESDEAFVRYSAMISYYRYVASNYRRANEQAYLAFRATLPPYFIADLDAIKRRQDAYPSWLDSTGLNDFYLKSQGVTEGVGSYSKMVVLVYSWRKDSR